MIVQEVNVKTMTDLGLLDLIEHLNMSDEWSASEWNLWNMVTEERKDRENERRNERLQSVFSGRYR